MCWCSAASSMRAVNPSAPSSAALQQWWPGSISPYEPAAALVNGTFLAGFSAPVHQLLQHNPPPHSSTQWSHDPASAAAVLWAAGFHAGQQNATLQSPLLQNAETVEHKEGGVAMQAADQGTETLKNGELGYTQVAQLCYSANPTRVVVHPPGALSEHPHTNSGEWDLAQRAALANIAKRRQGEGKNPWNDTEDRFSTFVLLADFLFSRTNVVCSLQREQAPLSARRQARQQGLVLDCERDGKSHSETVPREIQKPCENGTLPIAPFLNFRGMCWHNWTKSLAYVCTFVRVCACVFCASSLSICVVYILPTRPHAH